MKKEIHEDFLLDAYDVALLAALQRDAAAPHHELGRQVHLSTSQVSRRIQRLHSQGLIRRHVALLDAQALGLSVRAFTYVTLARHGGDEGREFEQAISALPEVLECYAVAGEADYILQIVAASLSVLSDQVLRQITRIQGVGQIRSNIVLHGIKSTTELPLDHLRPTTGASSGRR